MQLFELVSPRLFRPLAGPNRAFYAELLLLLWEECRHTADYSILRAEAVSRAEDYFAALAKPLALDADGAGDGLSAGNAVICRMAALLPEQQQKLCIKRPVGPRQRAEQPWADQFKQLHGNVLSV